MRSAVVADAAGGARASCVGGSRRRSRAGPSSRALWCPCPSWFCSRPVAGRRRPCLASSLRSPLRTERASGALAPRRGMRARCGRRRACVVRGWFSPPQSSRAVLARCGVLAVLGSALLSVAPRAPLPRSARALAGCARTTSGRANARRARRDARGARRVRGGSSFLCRSSRSVRRVCFSVSVWLCCPVTQAARTTDHTAARSAARVAARVALALHARRRLRHRSHPRSTPFAPPLAPSREPPPPTPPHPRPPRA